MKGTRRPKFQFDSGDLVVTVADERKGLSDENKIVAIEFFNAVIK